MKKLDKYEKMNLIANYLGFVEHNHPTIHKFDGVFIAGKFEEVLYSYERGLLNVTISLIVAEKTKDKLLYTPFLAVSTIDDGTWQAFHPVVMTLEDANQVVKNIYDNWEWKYVLPDEGEFNEFLMKFGLMGSYTG